MNKRMLIAVLVIALILTSCSRIDTAQSPTREPLTSDITSQVEWVSHAKTVNELMWGSNLVVRARVSKSPVSRVLRRDLSVLDENNNIVGTTISETLFSDTAFEVIKIYWGKPPVNLTVMQTGGFDPTISNSFQEVADDPLYKVGEEYILFLVDISGDKVQAPDRELYRIVNPFGRYRVDGENVFSYGQTLGPGETLEVIDILELEMQIEQAISLTPTPTSCGQPVSRPFLPNSTGNPLGSGDEVSLAEAKRRISYSIPLPELEEVARVWIWTNAENPLDQSVAICFKRDLLLIIHTFEKQPNWDKAIANEPLFKKIDVNGNPGMGADPGVTEIGRQPYPYPGSVGWWIDGLSITLYSDTMSLEELLKIAETTTPAP